MEQLHFQRQGVGDTLRLRHGNLYAECIPSKQGYHVEVLQTLPRDTTTGLNDYNILLTTNPAQGLPQTMDDVRSLIIASIADKLQREVEILPQIEAYMYYSDRYKELWPRIATDVYMNVQATYETYSNTIRKQPENYCIIAWEDGDITKPIFDVDAAQKPWRDIAQRAHAEFIKSHNQKNSDRENKEWLAWLISQWIKDGIA